MQNTFDLISQESFILSAGIVWGLVAIVLAVFGLLATVLVFHWKRYGMANPRIALAQIIFFVVSAFIILMICAAALALV